MSPCPFPMTITITLKSISQRPKTCDNEIEAILICGSILPDHLHSYSIGLMVPTQNTYGQTDTHHNRANMSRPLYG